MIKIEALKNKTLKEFLHYLTVHLSENGKNNLLFQPLSAKQAAIDNNWEEKFRTGINKSFGEDEWRNVWVAKNAQGKIVGHIDIRPRREPNTQHRVLLGMGVDSNHRKLKFGHKMLLYVIEHCKNHPKIDWLDLEVLTNNTPAIRLYQKMNFHELSTIKDMFRIEGKSYDYTSMTLKVAISDPAP